MSNNLNYDILIVDDEAEYQNVVSLILKDEGYNTHTCSNGAEALEYLKKNKIDLVITDLRMPVLSGDELITEINKMGLDVDIIVVTAYGSIDSAVGAMRMGATDYFVKSSNMDELIVKVERIAKLKHLLRKSGILLQNQNGEELFMDSQNPEFCQLIDMVNRTADSNINILLLGESGVGKEVVANYIHRISSRAEEPFIPVNCQVFGEGVIESELFGHEKGAFTGAIVSRIGKFEEANMGTLFLDEIGDLPLKTQGKLLRALETKSIEKVGSNKKISLDVRFISATNKDLREGIEKASFREDLLYRINTLTLTIPPLRERREDLPALIDFFVKKTATDQKKIGVTVDNAVMEHLLNYNYPGNIRELKNIVERMIALSRDGRVTLKDLAMPSGTICVPIAEIDKPMDLREARGAFEKKYIEQSLKAVNWNVEKCAQNLKITARQLFNKINQYNLKR